MSSILEVRASYHLLTDTSASVQLTGEPQPGFAVTLLHERFFGGDVVSCDFIDPFEQDLILREGETLTMLCRRHGHIVGTLINEILCDPGSPVLLLPKGGFNIVLRQQQLGGGGEEMRSGRNAEGRTPATEALAQLLETAIEHFAGRLPTYLNLIRDPLEEAIVGNDEEHSRRMLGYLRSMIEEECVSLSLQPCKAASTI